ncbi:MAG TPA: hypothetical protein VK597_13570 [Inquilinus sp.]|nr:hypothetical protein [Inquilinus sp.]
MHDALTPHPNTTEHSHAAPGWSPPVERLALGWGEVATSWLGAGGLLAILAVAALINRAPGGDVVYLSQAQASVPQMIAEKAGATGCWPAATPAAPFTPRPA